MAILIDSSNTYITDLQSIINDNVTDNRIHQAEISLAKRAIPTIQRIIDTMNQITYGNVVV